MARASLLTARAVSSREPLGIGLWTGALSYSTVVCGEFKLLGAMRGTGEGWLATKPRSNAPVYGSPSDDAITRSLRCRFSLVGFLPSILCLAGPFLHL